MDLWTQESVSIGIDVYSRLQRGIADAHAAVNSERRIVVQSEVTTGTSSHLGNIGVDLIARVQALVAQEHHCFCFPAQVSGDMRATIGIGVQSVLADADASSPVSPDWTQSRSCVNAGLGSDSDIRLGDTNVDAKGERASIVNSDS